MGKTLVYDGENTGSWGKYKFMGKHWFMGKILVHGENTGSWGKALVHRGKQWFMGETLVQWENTGSRGEDLIHGKALVLGENNGSIVENTGS